MVLTEQKRAIIWNVLVKTKEPAWPDQRGLETDGQIPLSQL